MKVLGIIPARFESTRLPGKPLLIIGEKTMIQKVFEQCKKSKKLNSVVVATDDERIIKEVESFGGKAILTSNLHQSGTDRCAEVVNVFTEQFDFVINIQGDEPFINPNQIDDLIGALKPSTEIATQIKRIENLDELQDTNKPKVILDKIGNAIYFSRHTIPFIQKESINNWLQKHTFFKHIGMYAYRTDILEIISKLPQSPLEKVESLEQLRWIENGYKIKAQETNFDNFGIDTAYDLEKAQFFSSK